MIFFYTRSLLAPRLLGARQQTWYLGLLARDALQDGANERCARASSWRAANAVDELFSIFGDPLI